MTKGIAGIGKTVAVQNFSLNWAEGKSNQHIDFIFVLPFRELNMLKEGEHSLLQLLLHFYPELKPLENTQQLVNKQALFIFDGLDESRFPLDFETERLKSEHLSVDRLAILLSTLQSADSCLQELCLVCFSNANVPLPHIVFAALGSPDCKLETLRLSGFALDFKHCHTLASILQSKQSSLRALDLTDCIYSYPQDYSGYFSKEAKKKEKYDDVNDELSLLTVIPAALIGPVCKLEEFSMPGCYLKSKCCQVFASVLSSNSQLRELDLSRNDLQDLGVQLLSVGLGSSKCRLEILRLSCCGITEEGCASLASALRSNPSHLRELDLSYNHPGESGVRLLSERLEDPKCRMENLNAVKLKMDAKSSFTPEVTRERIGIAYRFKFPSSGVFQCSLTELVFNVTHEGEVTYKTLIWDKMVLQPACKLPGGPLFSIECPQDSISQLHLPHCEPEPALVSESLSVVHITDDGMSILQPLEVTETHVVVNTPHLSAFGIVWDLIKRFKNFMMKPVLGQILLFLRPVYRGGKLILSVILLPSNVPLREVKVQHENEYIQAPPHCLLHLGQDYSLHSDPEGYKIQPARAEFFDNYGPNYHATFEINLTTSTEEVTLMVQDPDRKQAWEHCLHLPASPSHASRDEPQPRMSDDIPAEEKLRRSRPHFIDRVSYPVLNKVLDELLQHGVLNDAEVEAARVKPRADKARDMIDMVRMKGGQASSIMITSLSVNDPFLCKGLGLM